MKLRKALAIALAAVMALSMSVTAFAAGNVTTLTGKYEEFEVDVTVPTTGTVIINPYGMPYTLDDEVSSATGQLVSKTMYIANRSSVALSVGATVTAAADTGSGITFSDTAVESTEAGKKVQLQLDVWGDDTVVDGDETDPDVVDPIYAGLTGNPDGTVTLATANSAYTGSGDGLVVLREGNEGEMQTGGLAFFKLNGTVAKSPSPVWAAADTFTATVTFTFEPTVYTFNGGTLTNGNISDGTLVVSAAVTDGQTVTLTLPSGVTVKSGSTPNWVMTFDSSVTSANQAKCVKNVADDGMSATFKSTSTGTTAYAATLYVEYEGADGNTYRTDTINLSFTK